MRAILWLAFFIFLLVFAAWATALVLPKNFSAKALAMIPQLGRPILQLIVVVLVLHWFAAQAGSTFSLDRLSIQLDERTIITLLVILTYCVAALGYLDDRNGVKDLGLVVIGFYCGSTKRGYEKEDLTPSSSIQPERMLSVTEPKAWILWR